MVEEKMRAFDLEGKRRGIKLDGGTWQTIDWLASERGVKWAELAREWAGESTDENLTRVIRAAAINEFLLATVLKERGPDLSAMHASPLMRDSAALSDAQLDKILKSATVQGESDFGGFAVMFGQDEHGQDCVWIKNGLRDRQHFAFIVPAGKK